MFMDTSSVRIIMKKIPIDVILSEAKNLTGGRHE